MPFEIVYTTVIPLRFQIDMMDMFKSGENEGVLDILEQSFVLTEEEKRAVLQQKFIFWTNAMAEDLRREIDTPPTRLIRRRET